MATLINRRMFWALNHKIVPCFVVGHDLKTAKVTVLLDNGGRHEADAYDVRADEADARKRMNELRKSYDLSIYMAENYPNV